MGQDLVLQRRTKSGEHVVDPRFVAGRAVAALVELLSDKSPAALRKALGLPARALWSNAIAAAAKADGSKLRPLCEYSTGVYSKEDYLLQFDEPWEVEEYRDAADQIVSANVAAWHPPSAFLDACDAFESALDHVDVRKALEKVDFTTEEVKAGLLAIREGALRSVAAEDQSMCFEGVD